MYRKSMFLLSEIKKEDFSKFKKEIMKHLRQIQNIRRNLIDVKVSIIKEL